MEKIELPAIDAPAGYKHLYIVYTNDLGREFIVRAGPGPFTAFDYINVEWGQYTSTSRDWVPPENRVPQDTSLITEGIDLSDTFLKMAFFAQLVEEADVDYDTFGAVISGSNNATNSNTMASACLNFAGLPVTLADLPSSGLSAWQRRISRPRSGPRSPRCFRTAITGTFLHAHLLVAGVPIADGGDRLDELRVDRLGLDAGLGRILPIPAHADADLCRRHCGRPL